MCADSSRREGTLMSSLAVLAGRNFRLTVTAERMLVEPAFDGQPFAPLSLPPLAHSQVFWIQTLGQRVFHNARRCLGLSLILDTATGCWTAPLVPYQRCRTDGVAWTFNPRELADLPPSWRLGGSFQTVDYGSDIEELAAVVPPYDGMHVVAVNQSEPQVVAMFLRHTVQVLGGHLTHQVTPVPWNQLIYDDWRWTLAHIVQRLHVE